MNDGPGRGDDAHFSIWYRFAGKDGKIDHDEWVRACNSGEYVGVCRSTVVNQEVRSTLTPKHTVTRMPCSGNLVPLRPMVVNARRTDYEAECDQCGHTVVAPLGKTHTPSSMKSERHRRPWEKESYYSNWANDSGE